MPPAGGFAFGPFQLDADAKQLRRDDERVPLPKRYLDLLLALVSRAGELVEKEDLIRAEWQDQEVGDGSLSQAIFLIRRALDPRNTDRYIVTEAGRGYRFVAPVTRVAVRATDADIDAILSPPENPGDRRALETLRPDRIAPAQAAFEQRAADKGDDPMAHLGLAATCLARYEGTRADAHRDMDALRRAEVEVRAALRLDMHLAAGWAILGLVLQRLGESRKAVMALKQATLLEPWEWRNVLQLGWGSWGNERVSAAHALLALAPGSATARWLIASVFVGRNARDAARRELSAGLDLLRSDAGAGDVFPPIALHWLDGLLLYADGDDDQALASLERELARDPSEHIYGRETAANAQYVKGAILWWRRDRPAARAAFEAALALVPGHHMARAGLLLTTRKGKRSGRSVEVPVSVDAAMAEAAILVADGDARAAARLVLAALAAAPPGHAGWTIPVDPLLAVWREPEAWSEVLAALHNRAV